MTVNLRAFLTDLAATTSSDAVTNFISFVDNNADLKQTMISRGMGWSFPAKPDSLDDAFDNEPPLVPQACSTDGPCESCQ